MPANLPARLAAALAEPDPVERANRLRKVAIAIDRLMDDAVDEGVELDRDRALERHDSRPVEPDPEKFLRALPEAVDLAADHGGVPREGDIVADALVVEAALRRTP